MTREQGPYLRQELHAITYRCLNQGLCDFDLYSAEIEEILASLGEVTHFARMPCRANNKASEENLLDAGVGLHMDSVWARYVCIAWPYKPCPPYRLMLFDLSSLHSQLSELTALRSILAPCQHIDDRGTAIMTLAPVLQDGPMGLPVLNVTPCFWGADFFLRLSSRQLDAMETLIRLLDDKSKTPDYVFHSRYSGAVLFDNHRFFHKRDPIVVQESGQHAMRWWVH